MEWNKPTLDTLYIPDKYMQAQSLSRVQLCDLMDWPTRFLCPWDFPSNNTRAGCHFLLQGIFLTQGSNPGLPHCFTIWVTREAPCNRQSSSKNIAHMSRHQVSLKKWQPTPVLLPGEFHGQRSQADYSQRDPKQPDMTEQLTFTFTFSIS